MFIARVKLSGPVVTLTVAPQRPMLHKGKLYTICVDDEVRKKKLASLLLLLKRQKMNAEVKYLSDTEGELIAEVRCV